VSDTNLFVVWSEVATLPKHLICIPDQVPYQCSTELHLKLHLEE